VLAVEITDLGDVPLEGEGRSEEILRIGWPRRLEDRRVPPEHRGGSEQEALSHGTVDRCVDSANGEAARGSYGLGWDGLGRHLEDQQVLVRCCTGMGSAVSGVDPEQNMLSSSDGCPGAAALVQVGGEPPPGKFHDHERGVDAEVIHGIGQGRRALSQRRECLPQPFEVVPICRLGGLLMTCLHSCVRLLTVLLDEKL
jgi:hypothetical protein